MTSKAAFYSDVIITAVEGGIGYWSRAYDYVWSEEQPETTSAKIVQQEEAWEALGVEGFFINYGVLDAAVAKDDARLKEFTHTLDVAAVRKAFTLIRASDKPIPYASDEWRKRMRSAYFEGDAGELDASDADMVAQIATLGEVVYG